VGKSEFRNDGLIQNSGIGMREEVTGIPEDSEKIPISSAAAHQAGDGAR
jgi:hypothetical protein